jgi:hypothetical protein
MNNFLPTIKDVIAKYKLQIAKDKTKDVHELLCKYMETLIFNIVSIASIITMINNCSTIKKQTIKLVKSYINDNCNANTKQTGGMNVLPSEFYGFDSGRYSETNASGDILAVDFTSGILRPQIGGGGQSSVDNKNILKKINEILNYYKLKASDSIVNDLLKLITIYTNCFFKQLKGTKTIITTAVINKIIKSNKTLDIFK